MKALEIEGVEILRNSYFSLYANDFKAAAQTIEKCGHLLVLQVEGDTTVLYAVRPGLIRRVKQKIKRDPMPNTQPLYDILLEAYRAGQLDAGQDTGRTAGNVLFPLAARMEEEIAILTKAQVRSGVRSVEIIDGETHVV